MRDREHRYPRLPTTPPNRIAAELGDRAAVFEADVTDPSAITAAADQAAKRFGAIDVAVANAGIASDRLPELREALTAA